MWDNSLRKQGIRKQPRLSNSHNQGIENGTVIGNYRFLERIGSGGFGNVYRAESIAVYREVAIKVYEVFDNEALRAFRRGANLLAQANHPNIVTMFDFFTTDKYAMMVMELLSPHQTLRAKVGDFCSQEGISDFIRIFREILEAMRYCHQSSFRDIDGSIKRGIHHGDIKPDNIFFQKGHIKIADFMIPNLEVLLSKNKKWGQEAFPSDDTRAYGTPMYMCDEQMRGVVNEKTDIYNIGITAFELLTGFYPYDSEMEYRQGMSESPATYCPHSPEWLNTILIKCVADDSGKRYSHISEIEKDIIKEESNRTLPMRTNWSGPQSTSSKLAVDIFCCYAHEDEMYRQQLETHLTVLKRQEFISFWHDRQILAGANWANVIDAQLEAASIIVLLISADFIASDYCYTVEMKRALERHNANEARVVPIVVRPCDWLKLPLASLQALPLDAKPISMWASSDEAWTQVTANLRRVIEDHFAS